MLKGEVKSEPRIVVQNETRQEASNVPAVYITKEKVQKLLAKADTNTASGLDEIPMKILKAVGAPAVEFLKADSITPTKHFRATRKTHRVKMGL